MYNQNMKNTTTPTIYHNQTKHHRDKYAASKGYMDWETQPNPYRYYSDTKNIQLSFSDHTPPYHLMFGQDALPKAPLCLESVSQLLRYSLGLAAIKSYGGSSWALRCNASSGNLQPTECYAILPPVIGISDKQSLVHYRSDNHSLEILNEYENSSIDDGFYIILSSILWREAWKYGERSWRYCQLDAGHAYGAIKISAQMIGWECEIQSASLEQLSSLMGVDQHERFSEIESADMLLRISNPSSSLPVTPLLFSKANQLSPQYDNWEVLEAIDNATTGIYPLIPLLSTMRKILAPTRAAGEIILKRRSAQVMDGSSISEVSFRQILDSSLFCSEASGVNFGIFVNKVDGLPSGLYAYIRNKDELVKLQKSMNSEFAWEDMGDMLYLLKLGDYKITAKQISCNQDIAKDGAFSFGMLCDMASSQEKYGAIGYKNLFHQCGYIGQMLYLEATNLGLSATGIGCFHDDEFHRLLGLKDDNIQSLYHFTIGRAIVDMRLTTLKPYEDR